MSVQQLIKNNDTEVCGKLPVNLINLVQPYACLLVINKLNNSIVQVSENSKAFFNKEPQELIGKHPGILFKQKDLDILLSKLSSLKLNGNIYLKIEGFPDINGISQDYELIAYNHENYWLFEIELSDYINQRGELVEKTLEIRNLLNEITPQFSIAEISEAIAKEVRSIAGFDRVMIYQFDEEWNGTVIAESRLADMDSYMNLKFPASDVPQQVRKLYHKNPYRYIPDINGAPVKLFPVINPITNSFTDLSLGNIRAVPAVHVEYLNNMKVQASMSIPVIVNDKLWGLIACHALSAKKLSLELKSSLELLNAVISSQIASKLADKEYEDELFIKNFEIQLLNNLRNSKPVQSLFNDNPYLSLLSALRIKGAAIKLNGDILKTGEVPSEEFINKLTEWFKYQNLYTIYNTDTLELEFEGADAFKSIASGVIVVPLNAEKSEYFLGFRPEHKETVDWGGNPENAVTYSKDKSYHPRNSFEIWKQQVENKSEKWTARDLKVAELLKSYFKESLINYQI